MTDIYSFPDPGNPEDFLARRAQAQAQLNLDSSPDDAARAIDLGKATGIPSPVVASDLERIDGQYKARLTAGIIDNNQFIRDYINAHPLAAAVSNDDYGQLDSASQALGKFSTASILQKTVEGFKDNFNLQGSNLEFRDYQRWLAQNPLFGNLVIRQAAESGGAALMASTQLASGVIGAGAAGIGELYKQMGGNEAFGDRLTRDLIQLAQVGFAEPMARPGAMIHPEVTKMIDEAAKMGKAIEPYLRAGEEPPLGVHPLIDEVKVEQAKLDKDNLNEALKEAQKSTTRDRAPDLFADFARQHTDAKIGISADAIREIYGDKVPETDDNLLGWVPDIGAKLEAAEATGGDVEVPLADYLAKVEPEVAKELEDHVRLRPGGLTVQEAKDLKELPPEKISSAAVRDDEGNVFPGPNHTEATEALQKHYGLASMDEAIKKLGSTDADLGGFITDQGRYVDRDEALKIAKEAGQYDIDPQLVAGGYKPEGLVVEDLNRDTLRSMRKAAEVQNPVSHATHAEDRKPFAGPPPGFTKEMYTRYLKLIEQRRTEDKEWASQRALEIQRKTQTAEWKANREELRPQVKEEVETETPFKLDKMLRDGEVKLSSEGMTPEQRAALPKEWVGRDGVHPDDLAGHFGVPSGQDLVAQLVDLSARRKVSGLEPPEFLKKSIDDETDRRMEAKYGDLDKSIVEEARDQVLSETQEEILHQETMARAAEAGLQYPITAADLRQSVLEYFGDRTAADVSSKETLANAGRAGRKERVALLKGDAIEAFREAQRQELAFMLAREAAKLEKDRARFEKTAKTFSARNHPNMPEEFVNFIHGLLMKVGLPVKRTAEDLAQQIAASGLKSFEDFVNERNTRGLVDGTAMPVPDYMLDAAWNKKYEDLTVNEFRDLKRTIDMLRRQGRDENKVIVGGEKIERKEWVAKSVEQLKDQFPVQRYQADPTKWGKLKERTRSYVAAIKNMETFWNRLDKRDRLGRFNKMFSYPGAEAANHKNILDREFAQMFKEIEALKNPRELITPPFKDPLNGLPWMVFTRKNLEMVIANIGNDYNLKALTDGFGTTSEVVLKWIEDNTTAEDIDRAQRRWDSFAKAKNLHDTVERNVNGYATESIPLRPFVMHGKEYKGGYFPIIDDPDRSPVRHLMGDAEKEPTTFWPSVATGFTKSRTGAKHVLNLNLDLFPAKLNQVLHAIAFKQFVHNTAKIFRDNDFRNGIRNYYGKEYVEEMDSWLKRVAGNASYNERAVSEVTRLSNDFRQNVISTYIAFNPYTIQKHGLSAFMMSGMEEGFGRQLKATAEIGLDYFQHAVSDLFSKDPYLGNTLAKFVWDNLEEIQRRDRNWMETIGGQHLLAQGKTSWRNKIAQWGAKGVAISDMVSANPLGLAAYRRAFEETGEVGVARDLANRAVRRAHGSTAITNLPRFVAAAGPLTSWMTSLYGFWGTLMQRRIEWAEDIADTYKLTKDAEFKAAVKNVPTIGAKTFAYWIWPAMVEEFVTSQFTDDRRGLGEEALRSLFGGAFSTFLFLREIAYAAQHGREPSVGGLLQSPANDATNLIRDIAKKKPMSKQNAGKLIQDTVTTFGDFTGRGPKIVGSAARFTHDVAAGVQKPRSFGDWFRGMTRGTMKERIEK